MQMNLARHKTGGLWVNHSVLASPAGRASRMLLNLVSKINQCSQLTNSCMKLRAFLMGLLK